MNTHSPRHPTPFCRSLCQKFEVIKKRRHSIYENNARCHNCEAYIPRSKLIGVNGKTKAKCPCCNKTWMKGVYFNMGVRRVKITKPTIKFTIKGLGH